MKYIQNLSAQDAHDFSDPMAVAAANQLPQSVLDLPKPQFKTWCADDRTDHVFYSMCEGLAAGLRITSDNPVAKINGIVLDFDKFPEPVPRDDVHKWLNHKSVKHHPSYITETQSGWVRLVYQFATPIMIDPGFVNLFTGMILKEVGVSPKMAGHLDRTSLEPNRYFELGSDWEDTGHRIDERTVLGVLSEASSKAPIDSNPDCIIPMDVVSEALEKKYGNAPNWPQTGQIQIGSRVPDFWLPNGASRDAGIVRPDGITVFTERDDRGFRSWRDLLGPGFVDKYQRDHIAKATNRFYFCGNGNYLEDRGSHEGWAPQKEAYVRRKLRELGWCPKTPHSPGAKISQVDHVMKMIEDQNFVAGKVPVPFCKDKRVRLEGSTYLNDCTTQPLAPAAPGTGDPSNWPWLNEFLTQFYDQPDELKRRGLTQLDYLYAWLARFYTAAVNYEEVSGQALLHVGPTSRGKTLFAVGIVGGLVGGNADAGDYLKGVTGFNAELCHNRIWTVDDTTSSADEREHRLLTQILKRVVANTKHVYHKKYQDAATVDWTGRVIMSMNMDAASLSVIPDMDSSNRDKMIGLRIADDATDQFPSNQDIAKILKQELPHFARFLLDYQPKPEVLGSNRFGVQSYMHPFVEGASYDNSSRSAVVEAVDWFAKTFRAHDTSGRSAFTGTATELIETARAFTDGRQNPLTTMRMKALQMGLATMEDHSRKIEAQMDADPDVVPMVQPRPVAHIGTGNGKQWTILVGEEYDIRTPDAA